jgi:hypothetical protein
VPPKDKKPVGIEIDATKKALTNEKGTEAYVYYDIKNAAGDSIRNSVDVQWITSPSGATYKKSTGCITIPCANEESQKFTYGSKIVVTGVAATAEYNVTKTAEVEVGMEQSVDSIQIAGFVSKNDPTNVVTTLPTDFAKDTWYLVFKTFDQNGNPLDMAKNEEFRSKNLSITSKNPMLLTVENDVKKETMFSTTKVDGVAQKDKVGSEIVTDYTGVPVTPGDWVDKGGEVTLMIVPTKTGNVAEKVFVVGEASLLNSLEILGPVDSKGNEWELADGDKDVKMAYEALDTKGNKVTSYETIVRSSNALNLNCTLGTMIVKEENDGTAGIYWSDDASYAEYTGDNCGTHDKVPRYLTVTTVVVGGTAAKVKQMQVSDARIPSEIEAVKLGSYVMETGKITGTPTNGEDVIFQDQYGITMKKEQVQKFFALKANGWDGKVYGVKIDMPEVKSLTQGDEIAETGEEITFTPGAIDKAGVDTVRFSVASLKTDDYKVIAKREKVDNWNDEGNVKAHNITSVRMSDLQDFYIKGLNDLYEIDAEVADGVLKKTLNQAAETAGDPVTSAVFADKNPTYEVMGKYNGNDVKVPGQQGWLYTGTDSRFNIDDEKDSQIGDVTLTDSNGKTMKEGELLDFNNYGNPARQVGYELKIAVVKEYGLRGIVKTNLANAQAAASGAGTADAMKGLNKARGDLKGAIYGLRAVIAAYDALVAKCTDAKTKSALAKVTTALGTDGLSLDYTNATAVKKLIGDTEVTNDLSKMGLIGAVALAAHEDNGAGGDIGTKGVVLKNAIKEVLAVATDTSTTSSYFNKVTALKTAWNALYNTATTKNDAGAAAGLTEKEINAIKGELATLKSAFGELKTASDYADASKRKAVADAVTALKAKVKDTGLTGTGATDRKDISAVMTDAIIDTDFGSKVEAMKDLDTVNLIQKFDVAEKKYDKIDWAIVGDADDSLESDGTTVKNYSLKSVMAGYNSLLHATAGGKLDVDQELNDLTDQGTNITAGKLGAYNTEIDKVNALKTLEKNVSTIYKDVKLCVASPTATKIVMDTTKTMNPTGLKIGTIPADNSAEVLGDKKVKVLSQYGKVLPDEKIVYTISDYKEATGQNTHKVNSVQIFDNGSGAPYITGAEIGDTFTLTAKVVGKSITATCKVTVGADTKSVLSSKDNDSDKRFRKLDVDDNGNEGLAMIR